MKKYWFLYKNHLATVLEYRSNIIFTLLYESVGIVGVILFWQAVFRDTTSLGGMNLGGVLAYYLILPLLVVMVDVNISYFIGQDIRTGTLANYLLKPFKTQMYYITKLLAQKTVNYLLLVPFYAIPFLLLALLGLFNPTLSSLFLGVFTLLLGLILYTAIDFFLGYLAFWLEDVWAFMHVKNIVIGVLGGLYFPLTLVKDPLLANIIEILPFKYLFYTPLSYLLGKSTIADLPGDFTAVAVWSLIFAAAAFILWRLGLRRYEAFGR